ncbi:putative NADP FAD dependent oxidoreductase [Rosellinia necatrix]|uniref:Putative NADP FAD dependent oxidoreductase n=1 Tax=Rosellinia necatrix TaxID=77044 RepID=A0A1W2TS28_ROSNE|nr:putative NADP FAD dependent oxidoreductase [Rosellinia necatrix]
MNITIRPLVGVPGALVVKDAVRVLNRYTTYHDYILLPLILLASIIIYNRGSILPKQDPYAYKLFERPQQNLTSSQSPDRITTRNIAEKVETTHADLVIFWGSQSGVAEGFAQRLAHEFARRFKKTALVADLSDFDPQTVALIPRKKLTVFIMSTYGEGDPSDNALEFVAWARSEPECSLENLQYAAFGCGNRNYQHYNKTIDEVVAGLSNRGATAIMPTGKGDESTRATEEDFLEWKGRFFAALVSQFNLTQYEVEYEPGVEVVEENPEVRDQPLGPHVPFVRGVPKQGQSKIVSVPVVTQRTIATYEESDRTCVHLELDFTAHRQIKYKTGDHISVWPVNPEEEISGLLRILELEPRKDVPIRVLPRDGSHGPKVPSPTTPYTLFQHHLEICAPVPRESVLFLADLAPTERIKAELKAVAQSKGTYARFLEQNHMTLSRLLHYAKNIDPSAAATWAGLPLSFVIDTLPAMKPRTYSISSSPAVSPRRASITVSANPTRLAARPDVAIPGLASSYLASRLPTTTTTTTTTTGAATGEGGLTAAPWTLYAQVRASAFRLPASAAVPVVMVAAGTGIAPFRAFLQERGHLAAVGRAVGPALLFFGCRGARDLLYGDLLAELRSGPLAGRLEVVAAFSRDGDGDGEGKEGREGKKGERRRKEKWYVGDALAARGPEVGRLLTRDDAAFYVCGAAAMARSVKRVVREAVMGLEGWGDAEVDGWVLEKRKANRWFEDVWG